MTNTEARRVKVSRAQVLAAQLLQKLNQRTGDDTDAQVRRIAQAGRDAGIDLPIAHSPRNRPAEAPPVQAAAGVEMAQSEAAAEAGS